MDAASRVTKPMRGRAGGEGAGLQGAQCARGRCHIGDLAFTHPPGAAARLCWGHLALWTSCHLPFFRLLLPAGQQSGGWGVVSGTGTGLPFRAGGQPYHCLQSPGSPATPPCVPCTTPAFEVVRATVKSFWGREQGTPQFCFLQEKHSLTTPELDWIKKVYWISNTK